MKALLSHAPGGPESLVLAEVPEPELPPGGVLIAVRAIGVNFPDSLIIEDKYQFKPARPFAPGGELSGVINAVGADVRGFAPGDRVIASTGWGAMAERVAVDATRLIPMPPAMGFDEGAAFIMTYGTSHYALRDRAKLRAGEQLLVLGAAGGVGLAAVELGKAMGARVIAAASSPEKLDLARARGADEYVLYPSGALGKDEARAFTDAIKAATGGQGADVIYDPVGGDYSEAALRAIAWEGRFLVVGFPAGIPKLPLNLTLLKSCNVMGVFWGAFVARDPAQNALYVRELLALYEAGRIRPHVSARFPLAEGGAAIRALAERRALGKIVVEVG